MVSFHRTVIKKQIVKFHCFCAIMVLILRLIIKCWLSKEAHAINMVYLGEGERVLLPGGTSKDFRVQVSHLLV